MCSSDLEAGQAARTLWQLGGSAVAAEFAPILQRAQPATQTALLAEYGGLLPAATATLVHKLATDRAQPPTLRAAAALALGKSCLLDASADSAYQERVATVLRDAFVASSSSAALSQLAPVLLRLHATPPPLASLQAGNHPMDLALSPERLLALLLAVHPAAEPFCVSVVDTKGQSAAALQGVLRAWRSRPLMTVLPESTARLLPSPLRELR